MALTYPFGIDAAAWMPHERVVLADDLLGHKKGYSAIVRHEEIMKLGVGEADNGIGQCETYKASVQRAGKMECDNGLLDGIFL